MEKSISAPQTPPEVSAEAKSAGHAAEFRAGLRDGIPIALGYLAVSFTLGIAARTAGLTAFEAAVSSATNLASAGQYAAYTLIAAGASLAEVAVMTLIANARYLLMTCALSQHLSPETPLWQRLLVGFGTTDEIFGISIARKGMLDPFYAFGAIAVSMPGWTAGTFFGVVAGNILPVRIVSALSVALYGMFLACIIPPARKNRVVAGLVALTFVLSYAAAKLPLVSGVSSGIRTIALTVVLALFAAILFPVKEEPCDET